MTLSLEMLMNEVKWKQRKHIWINTGLVRVCYAAGFHYRANVFFILCCRFRVWSSMWFRSFPCRLWGRCRSPPQGACSSGEPQYKHLHLWSCPVRTRSNFDWISPTVFCCLTLWFRSFCSCLIEPVAKSPELRELVRVNLEFQVKFIPLN